MEKAREKENAAAVEEQKNKGPPPPPPPRTTTEAELPTESSPYVRYKDLEGYKMQGYGATGHQAPVDKPGGGGGTDEPTLSGGGLSHAEDAIDLHGVP